MRQDLLEKLPGYKGPEISKRGVDPEGQAFYYMDELADKIRQWIAADYHCRPHDGLVEPSLPKYRMSSAQMFKHGMARAGYIEVPRDPYLALEFLQTKWRTMQHYGVEALGCRYTGDGLYKPGRISPYENGLWPIQVNPPLCQTFGRQQGIRVTTSNLNCLHRFDRFRPATSLTPISLQYQVLRFIKERYSAPEPWRHRQRR